MDEHAKITFLVSTLVLLTICGFVGYLIMAKAKRYVNSKAALTASVCLYLIITLMRILLLHDTIRLTIGDVGWCISVFLIVFFAIKGVLAGKRPK